MTQWLFELTQFRLSVTSALRQLLILSISSSERFNTAFSYGVISRSVRIVYLTSVLWTIVQVCVIGWLICITRFYSNIIPLGVIHLSRNGSLVLYSSLYLIYRLRRLIILIISVESHIWHVFRIHHPYLFNTTRLSISGCERSWGRFDIQQKLSFSCCVAAVVWHLWLSVPIYSKNLYCYKIVRSKSFILWHCPRFLLLTLKKAFPLCKPTSGQGLVLFCGIWQEHFPEYHQSICVLMLLRQIFFYWDPVPAFSKYWNKIPVIDRFLKGPNEE